MIEIMRYSLIFLLLISTVIITASEQIIIEMDPKEYTGSSAIDLGAARKELSQGKVRNDPALQKLSTDLFQLLHPEKLPELIDPELHVQAMADHGQLRFLEGRTSLPGSAVHVYIYLKNGYNIMAVEQLCHEVTNRKLDYFYLSAWVKVRDLVALASLEEVRTIRTVMPPVYYTGTVTTQGDTLHKTAQVREDYNQGGSQIRVGVITDGVTHR
ncbi:MAG: hypothetical protein JXB60_08990, partial [Candidatus Cloacimonetes bacterium]|nr:hypothetical protein [Candidatus Cloacimonadota bacterium]